MLICTSSFYGCVPRDMQGAPDTPERQPLPQKDMHPNEAAAVHEIVALAVQKGDVAGRAPFTALQSQLVFISCVDSDNGSDYDTQGIVDIRYKLGTITNELRLTDRCESGQLYEYYCYENKLRRHAYDCPHLCDAGICVEKLKEAPPVPELASPAGPSCTDSDGGKNPFVKGRIELSEGSVKMDDLCISHDSSAELTEYFCDNVTARSETQICDYGCKDGACLSGSAPQSAPAQNVDAAQPRLLLSGFKLQNTHDYPQINSITFEIASTLGLDYVLVPIRYDDVVRARGTAFDWSGGMDYYNLFELADQYDVSIMPAFYKLGDGLDDNAAMYGDFVIAFLDEFYDGSNIKYIEFQNEPIKEYGEGGSVRFDGTPTDLRNSNNDAYRKVKQKYPEILVGTAGFMASAVDTEMYGFSENDAMAQYYHEYFNPDGPDRLNLDVLTLHHYPKVSSYLQTKDHDEPNFLSEADIFRSYRQLLDSYGYEDVPILATEGMVGMPFINPDGSHDPDWLDDTDVRLLLMERFVHAYSQDSSTNLIGTFISGIEASSNTALFTYDPRDGTHVVNDLYGFYKLLLEFTREYPYHAGHISGEIDSDHYWAEEFRDDLGNRMIMAFCPLQFWAQAQGATEPAAGAIRKQITYPQTAVLSVGDADSVRVTSYGRADTLLARDRQVSIELGKEPIFVELIHE